MRLELLAQHLLKHYIFVMKKTGLQHHHELGISKAEILRLMGEGGLGFGIKKMFL